MAGSDEEFETASVSSRSTNSRLGTQRGWSCDDTLRSKFFDHDSWSPSFSRWDKERGRPDGEKSLLQSENLLSRSSTTTRRSSGCSTASDRDVNFETLSSVFSDKRSNESQDLFSRRPRSGLRSRFAANFSRDDFGERMEDMIRKFDERCSRSLWKSESNRDRFFEQNTIEDEFFSRPRLSDKSLFQTSRRFPSLFEDDFDDFWSDGKQNKRFSVQDNDSGIYSDESRSRLTNVTPDVDQIAKQPRHLTPEKFEVDIDVKGFKASDLVVKTEGTRLVIRAKTTEAVEDGPNKVLREIKREFDLPQGVNPYDVVSSLMPDGCLRVEAPIRNPSEFSGFETNDSNNHDDISSHTS